MVNFKVTGLEKVLKDLDKLAKDASAPEMAKRMRSQRCPDHGLAPSNLRVVGNEVRAEFCCERLRRITLDAATKALHSR